MNRKTTTISIALAACLAGAGISQVASGAGKRNDVPAATSTGPAVSCVPLHAFSETRVRDDHTIDFMSSSRKGWRNVLPHDCPSLNFERAFSYETSLSQLCSTDIIHVLHTIGGRPERGAACGLGQFQPIELVK